MRLVRDVEAMLVDRCRQRHRLEHVGAAAREEGEPLHRMLHAVDVRADLFGVLMKAFTLGCGGRIRAHPIGQFLPQEWLEPIAAAIVRLQVQIEADERKRSRLERRKPVELSRQLMDVCHSAAIMRFCNL